MTTEPRWIEVRWTRQQQRVVDCLACQLGIPTRPVRNPAQRFDSASLAADLAVALHWRRS